MVLRTFIEVEAILGIIETEKQKDNNSILHPFGSMQCQQFAVCTTRKRNSTAATNKNRKIGTLDERNRNMQPKESLKQKSKNNTKNDIG